MSDVPITNALSQYDNVVEKTKVTDTNFKGRLSGKSGSKGLMQSFSDSMSSFLNNKITDLNALVSNKLKNGLGSLLNSLGLGSLDLNSLLGDKNSLLSNIAKGLLGKVSGALQGYLNNSLAMLKALGTDTIRQLTNATMNYFNNITEDFINNLKSTVYIDDKAFCLTIKGLYYSGADLAYNNHYLRTQCLKRDWYETLEFVDEQYGVKYDINYKNLKKELTTCSDNSCHKNLFYIFEKLYKEIEEYDKLISGYENTIKEYEGFEDYKDQQGYKDTVRLNKICKENRKTLEKYMVKYLKNLIVNSYTYTTSSDIRRFFTAYPKILKPKYYGSNDDKYNGEFIITESDCAAMLPFFQQHKLSESDLFTMQQISKESQQLGEYNRTLSNAKVNEIVANTDYNDIKQRMKSEAIIEREEARARSLKSQSDRSRSLAPTALTKGSKGVYQDSRARYPMQNDLKSKVKYRDSKNTLAAGLENAFKDEDIFTTPRNKNIKTIYILLASKEIYPEDYMINDSFYKRCKYKTMTSMNAAADKFKGILGTSFVAQALYDVSDAIDGSAYRYTKQMERYLLDPKKNLSDWTESFTLTFDTGDQLEDMELPEELKKTLTEASEQASGSTAEVSSATGANTSSIEEIEAKLANDEYAKKQLADAVRFAESIPMVKKREMILSYLDNYYKLCLKAGIEESELKPAYGKLTYYIFGSTIDNPDDLYGSLLDNATNVSLTRNIQTILGIQLTKSVDTVMEVTGSRNKNLFIKLYDLICNSLNMETSSIGFAQMTFNYDQEHLSTLLKQHYLKKISYLKSINSKDNPSYSNFYPYKDAMTKCFVGFDRNGIFGYSEEKGRIRYTNIETGDWRCIHYSEENGTFAAGSEKRTKNNGILKLNESIEEFRSTNIKNGSWKSIFEYSDIVFFVNDDDSLWYWDGNNVVKTNITDFSNYEVDYFENYDIIFLKGINNNGIKYWKNNQFMSITDSGDYWVYEPLKHNNYYLLYPTKNPGTIYLFNRLSTFISAIPDINAKYALVSWVTTIPLLHYEEQQQQTPDPNSGGDPSQSTTTSIPRNVYEFNLIFTTTTKQIIDTYIQQNDSNIFSFSSGFTNTRSVPGFDNKLCVFYSNKNNDYNNIYCNDGTKIYKIDFVDEVNGGTSLPTITNIIKSKNTETELLTNGVTSYNNISAQSTKYGVFVEADKVTASGTTYEIWYYDKTSDIASRNKVADMKISDIRFFIGENGKTVFGKSNNNYYILVGNNQLKPLLSGDDIATGWILEYVNNTYFMVNHTNSLGVKYISNNNAIATNLTDGHWNITCSDSKLFALSVNNTNKGIRYSSKSSIDFVEMSNHPYNYEDVYGYAYNPIRKVLYFGSCRDELLLNVDAINYDIDEFIYILTLYQIKQKLYDFAFATSKAGIESILNAEGDLNELLQLTDDELEIGPDPNTTYYYYDSTGNRIEVTGLTHFDRDKTYYIKRIDRLINNANFDINSQIDDLRAMEKSSTLYSELLTYAEALSEFDVDDDKVKESLLLSMINNYDYIPSFDGSKYPNSRERFMARIAYMAMIRRMYVNNLVDVDGTPTLPEEINTHEWNAMNNHASDDFLNSEIDDNGVVHIY